MIVLIFLLLGVATLIYLIAVKPYSYWSKKNVKTGKITRVFGENLGLTFGTESFVHMLPRMYNKVQDVRYIGVYQFQTPMLVVKCPELVKQMCVKDFDHFLNRRSFVPSDVDDLMVKNLLALKGLVWKEMRSTLSPSFTGSKMRAMFALMKHNARTFVQYFLDMNEKLVEVDFKDACTRYANDVIANSVFGLEVNSLKDKKNDFYMMGADASNFNSLRKKLVFTLYQVLPSLASYFKVSLFGRELEAFFMNLVKGTIKYREDNHIKRPDMLGLLLEARKGTVNEKSTDELKDSSFAVVEEHLESRAMKQDLTDKDIAAQIFVFFLAGFETVSSAMCFMGYELAANPDIQKRLIEEIDEAKFKNESLTYETLVNMTYLDMVLSETLRKWPLAIATDRGVTKPYTIQPELPDEKPVHLDVGDNILIPIWGLHRDPKYYENPEKFDPERFSPENRHLINPYTYLPFGVGPRNCIGSRFALLETKAMFFYLLSDFEIVAVEKTNIPLKLSKSSLSLTSENGFPFGLKRRH